MAVISLASSPLTTPAVAGQMEFATPIATFTPNGLERGVLPAAQFYRLNADLVGANVATVQNVFGKGVSLSAGTVYAFEAEYVFTRTAGVTSHTFGLGFGGTATVNNILYEVQNYINSNTLNNPQTSSGIVVTYCVINQSANTASLSTPSSSATAYQNFKIKGTVSINAGGTFIPQYTLSAAPGGAYSTAAGSYFFIYPIGSAGADVNVGTWA